jgi:hypothetical protein
MGSSGSSGSTVEVGKKLVELCRAGKNLDAVNTLYAADVVSSEVFGDEHMPRVMNGIDAIRKKNQWWFDNHTIHGGEVQGPYPNGDRFIVRMTIDCTPKVGPMANQRMTFEEAALYTVKDGKIAAEEFFYDMPAKEA